MYEESLDEILRNVEKNLANHPDPQIWANYQKLKNMLKTMSNDDFFDLPSYLTGDDLTQEDFNSLSTDQKAAHQFAHYLRYELKDIPPIKKRALILERIIECHRYDILGLALPLELAEKYGIDLKIFASVSPSQFRQLLMLMASGKL